MKNENTLIVAIIIILAILLFGGFGYGMMNYGSFGGFYGMPMMYGYNSGYSSTGMIFTWIIQIMLIVLMALGIAWLVKQIRK